MNLSCSISKWLGRDLNAELETLASDRPLWRPTCHFGITHYEEERTRLRDNGMSCATNDATTLTPIPLNPSSVRDAIVHAFQESDFTATSNLISDVVIVEEEPGEQLEEAAAVIDLTMSHHKDDLTDDRPAHSANSNVPIKVCYQ